MTDTKPAPLPPDFYTKTMESLRNLLGRRVDLTDPISQTLGDAEAAIGNLIVLEAQTAKERDAAQADATRYAFNEDREKARAASEETRLRDVIKHLHRRSARDYDRWAEEVETVVRTLGATPNEDAIHAAQRIVKERDEARAALPACEKTIARLEAERDEARAGLETTEASWKIARNDLRKALAALADSARLLNARPGESIFDAASRLSREHHIAENKAAVAVADRLAAIEVRDATRREAESGYLYRQVLAERNEARTDVHRLQKQVQDFSDCIYRLRAAFKCVQFEHVETAALRVVRERDAAVIARAVAKARALDWSTRYEALFAQSTHLAREVDRLKSDKADRIEASAPISTIKVGDRVVNPSSNIESEAIVIGFFDSVDGVRFAAVESGWGRSYFWRLDLCNPAQVST